MTLTNNHAEENYNPVDGGVKGHITDEEIQANMRLLREHYQRLRTFEKLRKEHILYLISKGLSKREIAAKLGISFQRVHQITKGGDKRG